MWDKRCRVTEVHDGDTVTVYTDDGKDEYSIERIRLFGTYAPELKQPGGQETQRYAAEWVAKRSAGDWPFVVIKVRLKNDTHELTTLGRWVGLVWTRDMTECLNVAVSGFVIANGYSGGIGSTSPQP